jgi:hypothetical protein
MLGTVVESGPEVVGGVIGVLAQLFGVFTRNLVVDCTNTGADLAATAARFYAEYREPVERLLMEMVRMY